MLRAIDDIISDLVSTNSPSGIHHRLKTIPKGYLKKYSLQSLYHFELPSHYRLMYTVRSDLRKEALLLQIISHNEYNKIFGYFKKDLID